MGETWTVLKILRWTADYFRQKGIDSGRLDAELLLADTLGLDRVGLYLNFDRPLTADELIHFRERVARRSRREPLQYILGATEFWSLEFTVRPGVLIPRADTETLVEQALKRATPAGSILDIGTGSGAIAVALAHELPEATVSGVDVSAVALEVAAENARGNGVEGRVTFRDEDLADISGGPYDLIVSNPPYIPEGDLAGLMPEVRDFEPREALCGGEDGLAFYRTLVPTAARHLRAGGWLLVEVGVNQAQAVTALFAQTQAFAELFSVKDAGGIDRVVGGRFVAE